MAKEKLWFRTKKYGWGWYPSSWEGFAVIGIYLLSLLGLTAFIGNGFNSRAGTTTFIFLSFLLTVVLLLICYKKGETPKWRWGK